MSSNRDVRAYAHPEKLFVNIFEKTFRPFEQESDPFEEVEIGKYDTVTFMKTIRTNQEPTL
jgi:hypothetical protein